MPIFTSIPRRLIVVSLAIRFSYRGTSFEAERGGSAPAVA
jgi:hypothetical protein